jgi:hypothetical protein
MPVTGASAVRANMKRFFKDVSDKKAPQFVQTVLSIGESHSRELAPMEYSALVNSIIKDMKITNTGVKGFISYGGGKVNYAAILELKPDWKPRPISKKKGPATNMNAKPHYLRRGFEDPESQAEIKEAIKIFKV